MTLQIDCENGFDKEAFAKAVQNHIIALSSFTKEFGKPRPVAQPLVEQAIKRIQAKGVPDVYVADYKLVEPVISLEKRKQDLEAKLMTAENEAKFKILPQRKIRLAIIKFQQAMAIDQDKRTPEQNEDVASYLSIQKVWSQFELIGANAVSDIDDLTEDTIDSWQLPKFD